MKVATASEMQNLDKKAIEEFGIPGVVLMENAGRGTVEAINNHFPDARKIAIFAGISFWVEHLFCYVIIK